MQRVVVLGSSGRDLTVRLPRLPAVGETCLGGALESGPGGKGANAAVAARLAGAEVVFITAYGDDHFGRLARADNDRMGLDLSHARTFDSTPNQLALIFVDAQGRNQIGVAPGASARLEPADIDALPASLFRPGDVLLACLELSLETIARGLDRAHRAGMTTILNPAPADTGIHDVGVRPHVDILTPNQEELRLLTGLPAGTINEAAHAARSLTDIGWNKLVVTLGDSGCLLVAPEQVQHLPAYEVSAIDTVGAGDAFNGALAAALAEGRTLVESARWANVAAALATTRSGAQAGLPSRAEIDRCDHRVDNRPLEIPHDAHTIA
jgi:ribokinase